MDSACSINPTNQHKLEILPLRMLVLIGKRDMVLSSSYLCINFFFLVTFFFDKDISTSKTLHLEHSYVWW